MDTNFFDDTDDVYETITMTDEDGNGVECFVIDAIKTDEKISYLLVVASDNFDEDEAEAFILKQIKEYEDEIVYVPVEDDDEYNKVLILLQENDTDYEMNFE